ncbi:MULTISPECIES: multicopper oxidase family protein [Nocardia]|uniref:multicopper oxidase family protein n=1 Tax=Nocardia abscessus TaxID=120957 RepID=UPI0018959037|nr:multicopper oxidase domain-containing protein [Nocardia abscessus]MBF6475223.1 multicopper oxidase domain-containing protein [Nocardia abscessus]
MRMNRREFLETAGAVVAAGGAALATGCGRPPSAGKADYTLRIGPGPVEVAPGRVVSTTLYNGQFPGPLLRLREGEPVEVDVYNDTGVPEQLHWHGQTVPVEVDGSAEEGTPYIPAHGMRRVSFTPGPSGLRFYHTHLFAGADSGLGQYNGQVGPVYIEPKQNPGAYDREVFLTLKEFEPSFNSEEEMATNFLAGEPVAELRERGEAAMEASLASGKPHGYEVGYETFTINGRMLGHGDPLRVREGERVLLHVLNGSATENRCLALPGHTFTVVATDGNPVPNPARVPVLWLGTAERISAVVEMTNPGVWVLGDVSDDRDRGMGIVIEYSGRSGDPQWAALPPFTWDYRIFTQPGVTVTAPDEQIELLIEKHNADRDGFNVWTLNGTAYDMDARTPVFDLVRGGRYRLRLRNATDDIHPIHLHRNTFEVTHIAGTPTAGLRKDVVMLGSYQEMAIDVVADQPGLSLLHCHQQLHMDYGFMALLRAT